MKLWVSTSERPVSRQKGMEKPGQLRGIELVDAVPNGPRQNGEGIPGRDPLGLGHFYFSVALNLEQDAPGGVVETLLAPDSVRRGAVGHAGYHIPRPQAGQVGLPIKEGLDLSPIHLPGPHRDTQAVIGGLGPVLHHRLEPDRPVLQGLRRGVEDGPVGSEPQTGQGHAQQHPPGYGQPFAQSQNQPQSQTSQANGQDPPSPGQIHPRQQSRHKASRNKQDGHRWSESPRM